MHLSNSMRHGLIPLSNSMRHGLIPLSNSMRHGLMHLSNSMRQGLIPLSNSMRHGLMHLSNSMRQGLIPLSNSMRHGLMHLSESSCCKSLWNCRHHRSLIMKCSKPLSALIITIKDRYQYSLIRHMCCTGTSTHFALYMYVRL